VKTNNAYKVLKIYQQKPKPAIRNYCRNIHT